MERIHDRPDCTCTADEWCAPCSEDAVQEASAKALSASRVRRPSPRFEITIHEPPSPSPPASLEVLLTTMACRSCGAAMTRGTQCRRCGAWCR